MLKKIGLKVKKASKKNNWEKFTKFSKKTKHKLSVAIAGKYFDSDTYTLSDAYHLSYYCIDSSLVYGRE